MNPVEAALARMPIERQEKITFSGGIRKLSTEYLAGIVDGEGCISIIARNNTSPRLEFTVSNCNKNLISAVHINFGGRIYTSKNGRAHIVRWSGKEALAVLEAIEDLLIVKGDLARLAIEFEYFKRRMGRRGVTACRSYLDRMAVESRRLLDAQYS